MLQEYNGEAHLRIGRGAATEASVSGEIIKGLASIELQEAERERYLSWANAICHERVVSIVAGKHRRAYDRAARVLGALAECYLLLNRRDTAVSLIHEFCRVKFPRHSAFRAELKRVMGSSALLKELRIV